jgi:hypothetical protein
LAESAVQPVRAVEAVEAVEAVLKTELSVIRQIDVDKLGDSMT